MHDIDVFFGKCMSLIVDEMLKYICYLNGSDNIRLQKCNSHIEIDYTDSMTELRNTRQLKQRTVAWLGKTKTGQGNRQYNFHTLAKYNTTSNNILKFIQTGSHTIFHWF